ncbi:conserved hypothetical protein [Rubrivivax sp. A210]|uniref:FAD-dependent oxidoreductase n=1 Tax=Rubrivivax sp. A210 TaxID=2772301 RepID=UPI00191B5A61|nr:FAD-dependent oxidoreductase [Rubrivivax sp. A210]CAD5373447.1 conserved hypothetical protein [Rubrivivax sp. A210]
MKIAVIGGGLAGLCAAWLLSPRHRVTLLERHARPGFVASSVAVDGSAGAPRVDVPLRVFYPGYYPTLVRLYQALGVASEPVSYAATFCGADGRAYFRWRILGMGAQAWPYVLPQDLLTSRARRIAAGALAFRGLARLALARDELNGLSLGDFVTRHGLAPAFVDGLLLPTWATIATCTHADALAYPAAVVAGYLAAGVAHQSVRRAVLGADEVAARLVAGITRVQCGAEVQALRADDCGVQVRQADGQDEAFDHVVLATQAHQALALWQGAPPAEAAALAAFRHRALEVVMHRDAALMPRQRGDWSAVNARVLPGLDSPEATIWVNAVQPGLRDAADVFQTVQPQREPRADRVISRARFERPLVDAASQRALATLQRLRAKPGRRVWLCGSYAEAGVPLLESAVRSAHAVAAAIDAAAGL